MFFSKKSGRRNFLASLGGLFGLAFIRPRPPIEKVTPRSLVTSDGNNLYEQEIYADPNSNFTALLPPLDSSVVWGRGIDSADRGTVEVLSIIMDATGNAVGVYPYPVYVQLTTAHSYGDATGINSTLFHSGSAWATATHAEAHQESGNTGTTIGSNVEVHKQTGAAGRVIGANVQSSEGDCDQGVNIQGEWDTALNFDGGSSGTRGIWLQGKFEVGLDLGNNHMRMNAGQHICLEDTDSVYLQYNSKNGMIEFWKSGKRVAAW